MEEVLLSHHDIVDCAVVSVKDELKGEIPVGFVVLKIGHAPNIKVLEKDLVTLIRNEVHIYFTIN